MYLCFIKQRNNTQNSDKMKTNSIQWTTISGDKYEVRHTDGNYLLYVNNNFTQCVINADGINIEDASRVLVNQYNEANDAENAFFKNNPQLNP